MEVCPICQNSTEFRAHGLIAPWICELIECKRSTKTELRKCVECDFSYFTYRYSNSEVAKLYSSYKKGIYLKLRKSWEPWLGSKDLGAYDPKSNPRHVEARRKVIEGDFISAGINRKFRKCVDFGGDQGQFFPEFVVGERILIDPGVQTRQIEKGVKVISSLKKLGGGVDLILNCFVMEHVSDLREMVLELNDHLSEDGLIYIQVPQDLFTTSTFHKTLIYKKYLSFLSTTRYFFLFIDFLTGIYRLIFSRIPFWGICKQSEHINYFTINSLKLICLQASPKVWNSRINREFKQGKLPMGYISAFIYKIGEKNLN